MWVIRCGQEQGSGFILKDVGLITCNHVIASGAPIQAFRGTDFVIAYNATVLRSDAKIDLAVLRCLTAEVPTDGSTKSGHFEAVNRQKFATAFCQSCRQHIH